jgi:hypothetical protein
LERDWISGKVLLRKVTGTEAELSKKSTAERKRGPAHAYQFGSTVIVKDEDGEVIKKYALPSNKKDSDKKRNLGEAQMRQGLERTGT